MLGSLELGSDFCHNNLRQWILRETPVCVFVHFSISSTFLFVDIIVIFVIIIFEPSPVL